MFIEERLEKILEYLHLNNRATVKELKEIIGVSEDTIRRDLNRLTLRGLVGRTHGGIMSKKGVIFDESLNEKKIENVENKKLIGKSAASLIKDSEIIIIDAGTTTEEIFNNLKSTDLTIITNALNIANIAINLKNVTASIIVGGVIRKNTYGIVGPDSINMIRSYNAQKFFMGISGISIEKGLMSPSREEAEIKAEFIKVSKEVIVVADSSKINKTSLFSFGNIEDISIFITDQKANKKFISNLREKNIEVIIASN